MEVLSLTKENFEKEVMKSEIPVLVDFWASWCGPCKMIAPIIEEIAKQAEGFKVGKVNVDENPDLAMKFDVMSIPTLVVIKDGKVYAQAAGLRPKEEILEMLK